MPSHRNIPRYGFDYQLLCYIDAEEARRLCADGSHEWLCFRCLRSKGQGPCPLASNHTFAVFETGREENDRVRSPSDCSLTVRDMERNAGITEGLPGEPPVISQVRRAQARIQNWAKASAKNRSVTIVPAAAL